MVNKLRWRLITIIMILLDITLILAMFILYNATSLGMRQKSIASLQEAGNHYIRQISGPPLEHTEPAPGEPPLPCFLLWKTPEGRLEALGSSYYNLSNTVELEQFYQEAEASGKADGEIQGYALRYLVLKRGDISFYVFTDITLERTSRISFVTMALFVAALLQILLFAVSAFIARWAVRPVGKAWQDQRQFTADASHELKTPLTVIITNAELLNSPEYTPEEKENFARNIHTVSLQMRGLVEDLLDQARVDGGWEHSPKSPLNISRLVTDALLPFEPAYFETGRELKCSVEPEIWVCGDADRLRQVVDILLDNGCKYSTPGTAVELRLSRQGRNHCVLSIISQGDTLSEQECKDIFKRFYRVDKVRSMNHSYGLGLSIAQNIAEHHGGKIRASSKNGENVFTVTLPTCQPKKA